MTSIEQGGPIFTWLRVQSPGVSIIIQSLTLDIQELSNQVRTEQEKTAKAIAERNKYMDESDRHNLRIQELERQLRKAKGMPKEEATE